MERASQRKRSTPLWVWIAGGFGILGAVVIVLGVFFTVSAALFFWLNGVTRNTLAGQNQPSYGLPNGRILYASDWEGDFELYLEKSGHYTGVRITHDEGEDINPAFSPDGNQIVFQSDRDGHDNLYIMDVDGGNLTPLTSDQNENWQPDWSPDGDQIAFSALGEDGDRHIYLIDIDGGNLTQITSGGHDTQPAWSPDGTQIVFVRPSDSSTEMYVINADGSNETLLVSEPGTESAPRWSPDGSRIAFVLTGTAGIASIYTVEADGSNLHTFQAGMAASLYDCPVWSPDGRFMGFVWGSTGMSYQTIQIYDISANSFVGTAANGGGTIQGCDWVP
jgi:Tol biopolymer transport system component